MEFVVDRRPSKTILTDTHLWSVTETAPENTASETKHEQSRRQHSGDTQDHSVEFSTEERKISSPGKDVSEKDGEHVSKLDRSHKREKRALKERSTKIIDEVTHDGDVDSVIHQRKKKHKSSKDANSRRTYVYPQVENDSENSAVVLCNETGGTVDLPHHGGKKSGKKRPKSSEVGVDEHCFLSPGRHENTGLETAVTEVATMSSPASQNVHYKKRSKPFRDSDSSTESPAKSAVTEVATASSPACQRVHHEKQSKLSTEIDPSPEISANSVMTEIPTMSSSASQKVHHKKRSKLSRDSDYSPESPAKSVMAEMATVSPPAAQKVHSKKRSKLCGEIDPCPAQTVGKDLSVKLAVTHDVSEKTESTSGGTAGTEPLKSQSTISSECMEDALDVQKSTGTNSETLLQLVMEEDSASSRVISDSDIVDSARINIPSTLAHGVAESESMLQFVMEDDDNTCSRVISGVDVVDSTRINISSTPARKVAKSPSKASRVTEISGETNDDSDLKKDGSFQSCVDQSVVPESPRAERSLTQDVDDLPSPTDGLSTGQITATETAIPVCVMYKSSPILDYERWA